MRNAVAATSIVVVLLCLAFAPCVVVQAGNQQSQPSTVDDTKQAGVNVVVLAGSSGASWDLDAAAFQEQTVARHRRSLKKSKSKSSKSLKKSKSKSPKKSKKSKKWSKNKGTLWGTVIGLAIIVVAVGVFIVFLLITEKKEKNPKWRVRDLIKRRVKPGVKRTFTRKKSVGDDVDDMETKKMTDDPPKLQGEA